MEKEFVLLNDRDEVIGITKQGSLLMLSGDEIKVNKVRLVKKELENTINLFKKDYDKKGYVFKIKGDKDSVSVVNTKNEPISNDDLNSSFFNRYEAKLNDILTKPDAMAKIKSIEMVVNRLYVTWSIFDNGNYKEATKDGDGYLLKNGKNVGFKEQKSILLNKYTKQDKEALMKAYEKEYADLIKAIYGNGGTVPSSFDKSTIPEKVFSFFESEAIAHYNKTH